MKGNILKVLLRVHDQCLLLVENIVQVLVVLWKIGQVVVSAAFNGDEGAAVGADFVQALALGVGNQAILIAVDDVNRTSYFFEELIGAQMVAQQIAQGQPPSVLANLVVKAEIR